MIVLCNLLSILSIAAPCNNRRTLNNYDNFVIKLNSSDLMVGLYLISIAFVDVIVGDNYVESDKPWRASFPCHALSFISMFAILMSTFFMLSLSIEGTKLSNVHLDGKFL